MTPLRLAPALLLTAAALALPASVASAAGQAPPLCQGRPATIVGTPGDDVLRGTPRADVIVARAGDDIVKGLGGDDLVCGGDGADRIQGGAGDDRLFGQRDAIRSDRGGTYRGPDLLDGGAGDDVLDVGVDGRRVEQDGPYGVVTYGSARVGVTVDLGAADGTGTATGVGRDRIVVVAAGRCGAPPCFGMVVEGSSHDDTLLGSAGPDHLLGGWGDDRVDGREGDDELDADGEGTYDGADDDVVAGGAGKDRIIGWRGRDVLDGGAGDDQVGSLAPVAAEVRGGPGDDDVSPGPASCSTAVRATTPHCSLGRRATVRRTPVRCSS
jgi:Ca2+-binding RTX toxin-like protein